MDLTFLQHIDWWQIVFYAFAAVTFIQLFYYLWFFSRVAFYKLKKKPRSQQHPVSVIVCARDEDENLARHLPGLLVQEYSCLLYTSDAADERSSVDLGGRRIIKK